MRYYIIAGEASGDLHGSNLIKGLVAEDPAAEFRFWGGDRMAEACGGQPVKHYRDCALMGLDVVLKAGTIVSNLHLCKRDIIEWMPDVVILIDYPGFNMRIAKFCHSRGVRVFYYIAPKTWASREGRNRKLKAWVDKTFIVFPFEIPYFESKGVPFIYKGNPLVDAVDGADLSFEETSPYIALLAGSRKNEISRMMPVFVQVAEHLRSLPQYSGYKFYIAGAPSRSAEDYLPYMKGREEWLQLRFGCTYGLVANAQAAIVNSGTASLETALLGTPQVVTWATSKATFAIAKLIVRIKYISLGNLIVDKFAFKELIQNHFNCSEVSAEVRELIENEPYRQQMLKDYSYIREKLGGSGASRSVAAAMISELKQ